MASPLLPALPEGAAVPGAGEQASPCPSPGRAHAPALRSHLLHQAALPLPPPQDRPPADPGAGIPGQVGVPGERRVGTGGWQRVTGALLQAAVPAHAAHAHQVQVAGAHLREPPEVPQGELGAGTSQGVQGTCCHPAACSVVGLERAQWHLQTVSLPTCHPMTSSISHWEWAVPLRGENFGDIGGGSMAPQGAVMPQGLPSSRGTQHGCSACRGRRMLADGPRRRRRG